MSALKVPAIPAKALGWRLLSVAFQYPEKDWRGRFLALLEETRQARALPSSVLGALEKSLQETEEESLAAAHFQFFGAPALCPYELSIYLTESPFEAARKVADLAGFYKAFGVESDQRADSLPTALEFLSLLEIKRLNARQKGWKDKEKITEDAMGKFIKSLVEPALKRFIPKLRERQAPDFYQLAADSISLLGGQS